MKFSKTRDVISPSRGHYTDAGIDFFIPKFNDQFLKDFNEYNKDNRCEINLDNEINLYHQGSCLIPSGIKVEIPYSQMGLFLNKSGVATKKHLIRGACVVDTFYSGEVLININNIGNMCEILKPDMKIIQMVLVPILLPELQEVDESELYKEMYAKSYRNDGGFGSTGK